MSRETKSDVDDGFLSRWSKRKLAEPEPEPEVVAEPEVAGEEKTDEEILEELGLPDPDELKEGDDFSGFMKGAVPTRLRNRALRKLWLTNPVLANLDEMVDYGEDFTDAATVVENLQTAYQVGKGWLPDEPEEADSPQQAAEPDDTADDALPQDKIPEAEPVPGEIEAEETVAFAPEPHVAAERAEETAPAPRRMRFRFDAGDA